MRMQKFSTGLILVLALFIPALAQETSNPFVGRWDFNIDTPDGRRASWLGVSEKDGKAMVWYQPTGGNVYKVKDVKLEGTHLTLTMSGNRTWELDAAGGKLTGTEKDGDKTTPLTGVR